MYRLYEILSSGEFEGKKVERDEQCAHRMLLNSAERGYPPACREVCRLFADGNPLGVDNCFAKECSRRCGESGYDCLPLSAGAQPQGLPVLEEGGSSSPTGEVLTQPQEKV